MGKARKNINTVDRVKADILTIIKQTGCVVGGEFPSERHIAKVTGLSKGKLRECITVLCFIGCVKSEWGKRRSYVKDFLLACDEEDRADAIEDIRRASYLSFIEGANWASPHIEPHFVEEEASEYAERVSDVATQAIRSE